MTGWDQHYDIGDDRPDQLDQWIALAVNRIRHNYRQACRRLRITPDDHPEETARTVMEADREGSS